MTELQECEFCMGAKGGVPGNENVISGVVVCDYCHVLLHRISMPRVAELVSELTKILDVFGDDMWLDEYKRLSSVVLESKDWGKSKET